MSMSRGCIHIEFKRNQWFGIIAQEEYDEVFRSFYVYGVEKTEEDLDKYLSRSFSNPGSVWIKKKPKNAKLGDYLEPWMIKAIKKHIKSGHKESFFSERGSRKLRSSRKKISQKI